MNFLFDYGRFIIMLFVIVHYLGVQFETINSFHLFVALVLVQF